MTNQNLNRRFLLLQALLYFLRITENIINAHRIDADTVINNLGHLICCEHGGGQQGDAHHQRDQNNNLLGQRKFSIQFIALKIKSFPHLQAPLRTECRDCGPKSNLRTIHY